MILNQSDWIALKAWSVVIVAMTVNNCFYIGKMEVRNSRVTKSSYEIELRKIRSHFELLTRILLKKFFFRVTYSTSLKIINLKIIILFFHFINSKLKNKKYHFELLRRSWKIKSATSSY